MIEAVQGAIPTPVAAARQIDGHVVRVRGELTEILDRVENAPPPPVAPFGPVR